MSKRIQSIIGAVFLLFLFPIASLAGGPLKLAVIIPETGIASNAYEPGMRGATLALEKANREGGVLGQPVEMIQLDNKSSPLGAKAAALEAVDAGVSAVVGDYWSSHSLPVAHVLQAAGVPMVSPLSSNPEVTRVGNYIFRACFTDAFQGQVMAHFAYRDLGARRAAVLENLNELYSMELGRVFKETFTALGGKIVEEGKYKSLDTDFTEMLKGVKESNPEVVFLPGYSRDSVLIIRQARQMELSAIFLGGDGWGDEMHEMAGPIMEGSYHSTHWDPAVEHEANQDFLKLYRERYGDFTNLDSAAPMTFDAVGLIVAAARKAGSTDRDKIREALAATRDYQGATGQITFNDNGDPEGKDAVLLGAKKGAWVFVKSFKP